MSKQEKLKCLAQSMMNNKFIHLSSEMSSQIKKNREKQEEMIKQVSESQQKQKEVNETNINGLSKNVLVNQSKQMEINNSNLLIANKLNQKVGDLEKHDQQINVIVHQINENETNQKDVNHDFRVTSEALAKKINENQSSNDKLELKVNAHDIYNSTLSEKLMQQKDNQFHINSGLV